MSRGFTLVEGLIAIVLVILSIVVLSAFLPVFTPGGCYADYSEGTRTGVVTKLSHKGVMMKSWEGEMNLGSTSTDGNGVAVPNVWHFSVKDEQIAKKVEQAAHGGRRTTLRYNQYLIKPWSIETEYVVNAVEVGDPPSTK